MVSVHIECMFHDADIKVDQNDGLFLHVKVTNYMKYIFINICSLLNTYEQGTHN